MGGLPIVHLAWDVSHYNSHFWVLTSGNRLSLFGLDPKEQTSRGPMTTSDCAVLEDLILDANRTATMSTTATSNLFVVESDSIATYNASYSARRFLFRKRQSMASFFDSSDPPSWIGLYGELLVITFNNRIYSFHLAVASPYDNALWILTKISNPIGL
jgi:hypothetical protein